MVFVDNVALLCCVFIDASVFIMLVFMITEEKKS